MPSGDRRLGATGFQPSLPLATIGNWNSAFKRNTHNSRIRLYATLGTCVLQEPPDELARKNSNPPANYENYIEQQPLPRVVRPGQAIGSCAPLLLGTGV